MKQINVIPASMLRVRRFLARPGGMRIEPWAGVDETLDAFYDLLVTCRHDDAFWKDLESLLADLTDDMRARMRARGGTVIDNEVLDPGRHEALLAEIRSSLDGREKGSGGFRRLASALSVPAVGLLLVMGGVATVGCEDKSPGEDASTDAVAEPGADAADEPDAVADVECSETVSEILDRCVDNAGQRASILGCLGDLHESWNTGLEELLACEACDSVQFYLVECLLDGFRDVCADPSSAGTFDLDTFMDNCATPIYLGLRFE